MEISTYLITDEIMEKQSDNFLKNRNKRRRIMIRRRELLLKENCKRRKVTKVRNFFKIVKSYADDIFLSHFRMARAVFVKLENALIPFWSPMDTKYSLKQSLYITLWKLGNSRTTYRELSDRFDVGKGTSHKLFFKTIKAICCLKGEISWPTVTEQQQIMESFQTKRANSFPFVIGCMDGIHFKINTPKHDAISYYDRKGVLSMIMQAICDSKLRFLDAFIGFPGSCHYANVWKSCPIFKGITSGEVPIASGNLITTIALPECL